MFINEINDLLTDIVPKYSNLILLGDFNISTENVSNPDTVTFNNTTAAHWKLHYTILQPKHNTGWSLPSIQRRIAQGIKSSSTTEDHQMPWQAETPMAQQVHKRAEKSSQK